MLQTFVSYTCQVILESSDWTVCTDGAVKIWPLIVSKKNQTSLYFKSIIEAFPAGWIGWVSVSTLLKPLPVPTQPGRKASRRCMRSATLWAQGMGTQSEMITLSGHLYTRLYVGHARRRRPVLNHRITVSGSPDIIQFNKKDCKPPSDGCQVT